MLLNDEGEQFLHKSKVLNEKRVKKVHNSPTFFRTWKNHVMSRPHLPGHPSRLPSPPLQHSPCGRREDPGVASPGGCLSPPADPPPHSTEPAWHTSIPASRAGHRGLGQCHRGSGHTSKRLRLNSRERQSCVGSRSVRMARGGTRRSGASADSCTRTIAGQTRREDRQAGVNTCRQANRHARQAVQGKSRQQAVSTGNRCASGWWGRAVALDQCQARPDGYVPTHSPRQPTLGAVQCGQSAGNYSSSDSVP